VEKIHFFSLKSQHSNGLIKTQIDQNEMGTE